jgi:hypothetical protein
MSESDDIRQENFRRRMEAYYSMSFALGRRALALIEPEPGQLPAPLEQAYRRMRDAKTEDEGQAAAREFLLLSKEWVD